MRVRVRDAVGERASTARAGWRLVEVLEPILAGGEPVVLDFADLRTVAAVFFCHSIAILVEKDKEERLPQLLSWENMTPLDEEILGRVVADAVRARKDPRWAAARVKAALKLAERD
jgi:hypothetical protein